MRVMTAGRSAPTTPGKRPMPGLVAVAALAVLLVGSPAGATGSEPSAAGGHPDRAGWVGSWASSPVRGTTTATCPAGDAAIANQTVRNIVFASADGGSV